MSDTAAQKLKKNASRPNSERKNKYGLNKKTKTKKQIIEEKSANLFKI